MVNTEPKEVVKNNIVKNVADAVGALGKQIWDNYTQAQENEVRDNEIQMEGTRQWVDMIYKEDASAWSPEMREGLHQAFDITANFPWLGGICETVRSRRR